MREIFKQAGAIMPTLVEDRRKLHAMPEIGHNLPQTTAYIKERLAGMGYEPLDFGDGGVVALAGNGKRSRKVILLRADMDALPLAEASDLPFASANGNCHACGHDIHAAMLLGAASLLKKMEHELSGTVKLLFQPAEETLSGARSMIDSGVLENPKVGAAFAMHVAAELPVGVFGYNTACAYASIDSFQIDIQGKGTHGAQPQNGIDPLNVAAHIHIALQEIPAREVSAHDTMVITVGQMIGGQAMNIIPESARMTGSIRAYSTAVRDLAVRRVQEISENIARAFNATAKVTFLASVPSLFPDKDMVDFMLERLKSMEAANAAFVERKTMGSEDFAFISGMVPSAFLFLGAALADEGKRYSFHNPKIVFDENCMPFGVAAHVGMAVNWLAKK